MINKVCKIITNDETICFIIHTEGEQDFWYWEISRMTWSNYWKDKNSVCLNENIMEWTANDFVNSDECSHCGCSVSSFLTVEEAIKHYQEG